jgi:HD superfamily phosphohydrolase
MARYYMFTQVYFNVTSKVMELHFSQWLRRQGRAWSSDPEAFLAEDDISVLHEMRQSDDPHARAIIHRERFSLAFETGEHLRETERRSFEEILPRLRERFGAENLLIDNSAKDPHRMEKNRVMVRMRSGAIVPMAEASDFIKQLSRIDAYRVYAPKALRADVAAAVEELWHR